MLRFLEQCFGKIITVKRGLVTESRGSLTLEAAIVFPVFLAFMLALINFINVAMIYLAMDHAVSETAKQIATHAYPLKYIKKEEITNRVLAKVIPGGNALGKMGSDVVKKILADLGKDPAAELTDLLLNPIIQKVAQAQIKEFYPLGSIRDEDFEITYVKMYNPNGSADSRAQINDYELVKEDIALAVDYKVKLRVPFFSMEINLSNTAVERAWADD